MASGKESCTEVSKYTDTNNNSIKTPSSTTEFKKTKSEDDFEGAYLLDGIHLIQVQSISNPQLPILQFKIVANTPDGNCLFRAISQALCKLETHHNLVREQVVDFILDDTHWPNYFPHIQCQHENLIHQLIGPQPNKKDASPESENGISQTSWKRFYQKYMSQDRTFGTLQELIAASQLYTFKLIILRQLSNNWFNFQEFHEGAEDKKQNTLYFLFTGSGEDGHFEWLDPMIDGPSLISIHKGFYKVMDTQNGILQIREVPEITSPPSTPSMNVLHDNSFKSSHSHLKMDADKENNDPNANIIFEPVNSSDLMTGRNSALLIGRDHRLANEFSTEEGENEEQKKIRPKASFEMEFILNPKPSRPRSPGTKQTLTNHRGSEESYTSSLASSKSKKEKWSVRHEIRKIVQNCVNFWRLMCCWSIEATEGSEDDSSD